MPLVTILFPSQRSGGEFSPAPDQRDHRAINLRVCSESCFMRIRQINSSGPTVRMFEGSRDAHHVTGVKPRTPAWAAAFSRGISSAFSSDPGAGLNQDHTCAITQ